MVEQAVEWIGANAKAVMDVVTFVLTVLGAIGGVIWVAGKVRKFQARRRAGKDLKSLISMVDFHEKSAAALSDFEANRWGAMAMLVRDLGIVAFSLGVALILATLSPVGLDVLFGVAGLWLAGYEFDKLNRTARAIHGGTQRLHEQAEKIKAALDAMVKDHADLSAKACKSLDHLVSRWAAITAASEKAKQKVLPPPAIEMAAPEDPKVELENDLKSLIKKVAAHVTSTL